MTTEQICFRYDGSPEAEQALKWVNETFDTAYGKGDGIYYYNHLLKDCSVWSLRPEAIEVPPAEFLRIVKGETQWTPKHGEEVEVSDDKRSWVEAYFCCPNPNPNTKDIYPHCAVIKENHRGGAGAYKYIRPIRKSLREEMQNYIQDAYNCFIPDNGIDHIISICKKHNP